MTVRNAPNKCYAELEFTGERVVPNKTPHVILQEHISRYIFASEFFEDKVIIDVACGTGYGSYYLLKKGAKKVIAVDISKEAIEYASNLYKENNLEFVCADATRLPFCNDLFDGVVSFETIEHLSDYEQFLIECKRVLKKGGVFICSTPNKRVSSPHTAKPLNPFHLKEFYYYEFKEFLDKYFNNVKIHGQIDVNLIKKNILKYGGTILSSIPNGSAIRKKLVHLMIQNESSNHVILNEIFDVTVDETFKVSTFKDKYIASAFMIAVGEKGAE